MREFKAILSAIRTFPHDFSDTCIRLFSDNTGVVRCINNSYSKHTELRILVKELFSILHLKNASITASYLTGMDNVLAD